jgi:hypothetical protein
MRRLPLVRLYLVFLCLGIGLLVAYDAWASCSYSGSWSCQPAGSNWCTWNSTIQQQICGGQGYGYGYCYTYADCTTVGLVRADYYCCTTQQWQNPNDSDNDGYNNNKDPAPSDPNCPGNGAVWQKFFNQKNNTDNCNVGYYHDTTGTCEDGIKDGCSGQRPGNGDSWTSTIDVGGPKQSWSDIIGGDTAGDGSTNSDPLYSDGEVISILQVIAANTGADKSADQASSGYLQSIATNTNGLNANIQAQTAAVTAQGTKLDLINTSVSGLGGRVDNVGAAVSALGTGISGVTGAVNGVNTSVQGLGTKIDSVGSGVGALGGKLDGVKSSTDALGGKLDNLKTDSSESKGFLSTLVDKVTSLVTSVTGISSKVDDVKQGISDVKDKIPGLGNEQFPDPDMSSINNQDSVSDEVKASKLNDAKTYLSGVLDRFIAANPLTAVIANTHINASGDASIGFSWGKYGGSSGSGSQYSGILDMMGLAFVGMATILGIMIVLRG